MAFSPSPGTIVTGNTTASRQFRRDFDSARRAEGLPVWDSPDILPRDAWLGRTWRECAWREPATTPVLLTRWQELALWEEAIESTTRDVLLNAHATASAAREAWRLLQAYEFPALGESGFDPSAFDQSDDTRAFYVWMRGVREQLLERGWISIAELPRALREQVTSGALKVSGGITLAGFDEIAPADQRLFEALGAREAAAFSCASRVTRAVCHDASDELTQAAVWARQKLETPGAIPVTLGIAVPGLGSIATIAERIFDNILHPAWGFKKGQRAFAISERGSLGAAPMVATALLTLRLIEKVPREEAAMLWRSPFLGIDPGEGARLDVELRRQQVASASLRLESVRRRFPEMSADAARLPARLRPSQWSAEFWRLLRLAGWPGARALTSAENQTLESWKDLLSELARLDAVLPSISCGSAISRLERMAGGTRLANDHENADENAPVQILDIEETAGSRFDALWIAGLHAVAWPPRARPNPFLPLALQRAAGMPHASAEREAAYSTRVRERLFTSANEVVCSFPCHADDDEQRPSPFIAALPLSPELPQPDTAARRVFLRARALEARRAEERLPLPAGTMQRGGVQVLADQSACPFRAFAVHRLRARELDEADVGLSALDRGSVVHKTLELLWTELQTQTRLKALPQDKLESLIRSCAESALEQFVAQWEPSRALDQFRKLEQSRLEGLLWKWLEFEKTRRGFVVIQSENARTVEVGGLTLETRVDRIDRYDDGSHAIIDYKTSKEISTDMWKGERPEAPQLPLYATTGGLAISEVAFAQIATGSLEWKGLHGSDLRKQLPSWDAVTRKLARDFLNGLAEVDPREKPKPCDKCQLSALCRITELSAFSKQRAAENSAAEDRDE